MDGARNDIADRVAGALLGLAAGDALGATTEFRTPEQIRARHGVHREIVGGGAFGWRPGQGTDDTDMAAAVLRAYLDGYTLEGVAANFLAWYASEPRDIGNATRAALQHLRRHGDPRRSGRETWHEHAAGNGSLMRCLPTALVRPDAQRRRHEAQEISAVTHADPRCVDACVAYCDLVAALLDGAAPAQALDDVLTHTPLRDDVKQWMQRAVGLDVDELDTSGFVLASLQVGVWAVLRDDVEETLVAIVNRGGDADTTGAIAGALVGAAHGRGAIPGRWVERLEYREEFDAAVPRILQLRAS